MKFDLNLFKASAYRLRESFSTLIEKESFVTKKLLFTQIELLLQTQAHPNLVKTFAFGLAKGYLLSNSKGYILLLQLGPFMEIWTKNSNKKENNLFEEDLNLTQWSKVCNLTLEKNILSPEKWKIIYEKEKDVVTEFESVASLWGQVYIDAVFKENKIFFNSKIDFEKIEFLSFNKGSIEFRKITSTLLPPVLHGQALKDLIYLTTKNKTSSFLVKTLSLSDAINSLFLLLDENNHHKFNKENLQVSLLKKDRLVKISYNNQNYYFNRIIQENHTALEVHKLPGNNNFSQIKQFCAQKYNSLMFKAIDTEVVFMGGYSNEIWDILDLLGKSINE